MIDALDRSETDRRLRAINDMRAAMVPDPKVFKQYVAQFERNRG